MHTYAFWRMTGVIEKLSPYYRKQFNYLGIILWASIFLSIIYGHTRSGWIATLLEFFGMTGFAIVFLLAVCFLMVDIITGFGLFMPNASQSLRGWAIVIACILTIIAFIQGLRPPIIKHYTCQLNSQNNQIKPFQIAVLSDLHIGKFIGATWLKNRVDQVMMLKPDMIVLLGDIFDGHGFCGNDYLNILKQLKARLGVYAILGNHEHHDTIEPILQLYQNAGIVCLQNQWHVIQPGLNIVGIDFYSKGYQTPNKEQLIQEILNKRPEGTTILLTHPPLYPDIAANNGVDLMLCGHTHGGQIWPFGYIVYLRYHVLVGEYHINSMPLIISRGTGTWGPRMRLWYPGEILLIN